MMQQLGRFIVKWRWWVLLTWVVAAVLIVSLSPKLSSVESNDQSSFLPKTYESIKAFDVAGKVSPEAKDATDIIVFKAKSGQPLTAADQQAVKTIVTAVADKHLSHVVTVITS